MKHAHVIYIDQIPFDEAWDLQRLLYTARREKKIPDTFLVLEHPHTFTMGKTGSMDHLLLTDEELEEEKIYFSKIDRGGDITYHGPGQMVVYPILDLNDHYRDLHRYLRDMEQVIINMLSRFDISSGRVDGLTGVWVNDAKICAIGVKVSRWITMHGLAFNHTTDLSYFKKIVPCGISDKPVCSLDQIKKIEKSELFLETMRSFSNVFALDIREISFQHLMEIIG